MHTNQNAPIFFDPTNKRGKIFRIVLFLTIVSISIVLTIFLIFIIVKPSLPKPAALYTPKGEKHFFSTKDIESIPKSTAFSGTTLASTMSGSISPKKIYAFGVEWDDQSFASLQENIASIDAVILEELTISGSSIRALNDQKFQRTLEFIRTNKPQAEVIALINNFNQSTNTWDENELKHIFLSPENRKNFANEIIAYIQKYSLQGINLDFEEVNDEETFNGYLEFLWELQPKIHALWAKVSITVPMQNDTIDLEEISKRVDQVFLMAYDEHWSSGEPWPIASQDWFIDWVKNAIQYVPRDKLVIILGNYGYDWQKAITTTSESRTFSEINTILHDAEENIIFDTGSLNPSFFYLDEENIAHEVWFLDAATAYNQMKFLDSVGLSSIGLWRLGSEDPGIWKLKNGAPVSALNTLDEGYSIEYTWTGEFYKFSSPPTPGSRSLLLSGGLIHNEYINSFPKPYTINRFWGVSSKQILLSFDDGPDVETTPKVLDILKEKNVKGLFFVIGKNAEENPFLLKRVFNEGHTLWNHSFTHPDISKVWDLRLQFELNGTQRVLENILFRKTIFFRPPYWEDIEPEVPSQVSPLIKSNEYGYITVGMKIDPNDWANPWVDTIVQRVLDQAEKWEGNIVLLHDWGGDRRQTIEALPKIIDTLRAHGFTFITPSDLLWQSPDTLMPKVEGKERMIVEASSIFFWILRVLSWAVFYIFILSLFFGIFRLVLILTFAFLERHKKRGRTQFPKQSITTTVIVPAYNEEKVILKTLDSLLKSHNKEFHILVVDDGSTDSTVEIVRSNYTNHRRVQLIEKSNSGKWDSLNTAMASTDSEIVIIIDADTVFDPYTIDRLIIHFYDPKVGAVSGNVKVGNRINTLTKLQAVEYITSQNIDKQAFNILGAITVVPWAVGAWRKSIVEKLGGFSGTTLAEDSDMTLLLLENWYKVVYEEDAYAYTEAPETPKAFWKQRFRWTFWLLQVTRKHIHTLFSSSSPKILRYFIFPSFILFQIVIPIIAPIFDILVIVTFCIHLVSYIIYGGSIYLESMKHIAVFVAIFLLLDVLVWYIAFYFDKKENKKLLFYLIPQRLYYRIFMYYISLKSLKKAIDWNTVWWGKLERTGKVQ